MGCGEDCTNIDIEHHAMNSRNINQNPFSETDPRSEIWINLFKEFHDYLGFNEDEENNHMKGYQKKIMTEDEYYDDVSQYSDLQEWPEDY